MISLLLSS